MTILKQYLFFYTKHIQNKANKQQQKIIMYYIYNINIYQIII